MKKLEAVLFTIRQYYFNDVDKVKSYLSNPKISKLPWKLKYILVIREKFTKKFYTQIYDKDI